ncbi:TetR/AcrR family transcriptional regulator [Paenibacillus ihumii]|uniref:TetR/AcrR family transcriptional regulator n=1 Tax=Paenibacillus ihumii TaxID=687436 RepID=UPI0006D7EC1C|nr:TetR family transcriptional regulator [Paenibacillus ihumii]
MRPSADIIIHTAIELARRMPCDKITYADIAREAKVHWTTVQRHFGGKEAMRAFLKKHMPSSAGGEQTPALEDTRSRILHAASRVFAQHGYEGAALDLVAAEAGLTKGAVYWHFAGKSDLFLAICERSLSRLMAGLPQQAYQVAASGNPEEALRRLLESEFASCELDGGERPLLLFEFVANSRNPEVRAKLGEAFAKLFLSTTGVIAALQQQGLITEDRDPHSLAVSLHAMINGAVLMWLIAPDQVSLQALSADISSLLWNGLRPERSKEEN